MRRYSAFFATLCIFSHFLIGQESRLLNFGSIELSHVAQMKRDTAQEIQRKSVAQKAIIISLLATSGYFAYRWAYPVENVIELPADEPQEITIPKESLEVQIAQIGEYAKQTNKMVTFSFNADMADKQKSLLSFDSLKSYAYWIGGLFGNALIFGIAGNTISPLMKYFKQLESFTDRAVGKVFHEVNLKWFLTTRVHLPAIFSDLEMLTKQLDELVEKKQHDSAINFISEHEFHQKSLNQSWAIFIKQMEGVLGFMEYRRATFVPLVQERVNQIAHHVFQVVFKTANDLQLKSADENMSVTYTDILQSMRTALDRELKTFVDIEVIDFA
jgi:hypothetical protein